MKRALLTLVAASFALPAFAAISNMSPAFSSSCSTPSPFSSMRP